MTLTVKTLEELEYPRYFHQALDTAGDVSTEDSGHTAVEETKTVPVTGQGQKSAVELKEKHLVVMENQRGISFDNLFGPYLHGARHITITDPYIRLFDLYQQQWTLH